MKKPTQKGLAIEYLTTRGFKQTSYEASSKYVLMTKTIQDNLNGPTRVAKYWIGKAGAVRVGTSPSNSTSVTASFRHNLAAWLKEQKDYTAPAILTPLRVNPSDKLRHNG